MDDIPIGALIRAYRKRRGMRIADVAEASGITTRYLEMIEAGRRVPSFDILARIADALGVPMRSLIDPPSPATHDAFADLEDALFSTPPTAERPADVHEARRQFEVVLSHWIASMERYRAAVALLPDLVRAATSITATQTAPDARTVASEIFRLAEDLARPARPDLAAASAHRAQQAQQQHS